MILKPKAIDCDRARSMIFEYVDGSLCEADAVRLEAHIAECDACRRELDECRQLIGHVKKSAYSVPAGLHESVMNKIGDIPQEKAGIAKSLRFKPWMGALTAVCAALMILVVGRGYIDGGMRRSDMVEDQVSGYARIDAGAFDSPNAPDADEPSGDAPSDMERSAGETVVTVATDSFAGFAPSTSNEYGDNVSHSPKTHDSSLFDVMLDEVDDTNVAVLVCRKSDFEGIIPDTEALNVTLGDAVYERYVIDSDAMVTFTGYLELLEKLSIDYRATVPDGAQFEVCEIYLFVNGEN